MDRNYLPVLLLLGFVVANAVLIIGGSHFTMRPRPTPEKQKPYESGIPTLGDARERFSVKFYLTALLFVLFDLEVVILIPWCFVYRDFLANHIPILGPILFFLGVLVLGLYYEVKKGALEWEK